MSRPLFEARVQLPLAGFEPAFLEVSYISSRLPWQLGHRALWILISKSNLITVKSNTNKKRKNNLQLPH